VNLAHKVESEGIMVKLTRAQIRPGVKGVDVTVKSAKGYARAFSPTWPMVMGYKNGTLTEAQYTEQYLKILDAVSVEAWRWLYAQAVNGEVVLLCFCRDGQFCHTRLITQYATEKYPKAFSKA
jgi:hypothetical protein